jgi:hypothetical protein
MNGTAMSEGRAAPAAAQLPYAEFVAMVALNSA